MKKLLLILRLFVLKPDISNPAGALNSGIYFVKLSAGGFNSVIKIVLLK